jgi:hypothetical protein
MRLLRSPVAVAVGLLVALIAGFVIGKTSRPGLTAVPVAATPTAIPSHSHGSAVGAGQPATTVSAGGYTLSPATTTTPFTFRILGPNQQPVTAFAVTHDKQMHLIVVRHDLTGYQHLHPTKAPDGTWSVPLALRQPGIWRAYAEFAPSASAQTPLALAVDLTVPGDYHPAALPAPAHDGTVDGFAVSYEGSPQAGATVPVTMRVYSGGAVVTDLQRYLGAYGHLVILRPADLAYLHVHPDDQLLGGAVKFWFAAPSAGRYRAFFEFQRAGSVHTAEFTMQVG